MGLLNQDLKELLFFSIFPLIVIILMALITRRASDSGKKKMVTPRPKLADLTYNITMRMIGGTNSVDDIHEKGKQFAEVVKEALRYHGDQNLEDFIPAFRYLDVNGLKKKMVDLMTRIDKLLENLLLKNCNNTNIAATQGGSLKEKKAFIDTLLALQESEPEFFTHQTIKAIILSLIGGGSETTVTTLEWAMSLLLNNPNAMQKAVEEIEKVVGRDRLLEDRDVPKLSYLNNVIIETLRLYPPLPLLLPHKSREDTQIAGYHIPKGTLAMFSLWTIHRDPKLWDEPDKFKPERFDQKEDIGVGNQGYNLLPFGLGRRSCPATNSTKRLLTFVLGAMIQAFEFNLVNGVENVDMTPGNGVIMAKSNPLEVFIRPRQITVQTFGSE
ncbi:OLC1v1005236C2 [Oldenlandia corymbosa var. corymbosa]|uniref:OLC1v1005236C2 n=1 Tax=Oldenlandia corymbosa var. corymbosa TaxID=529605 RepID=A0AAV1DEE0_OLDCO|nr:OLC1v1005236C2 [Oldenlandia corymbosa var. corymbosa]